MSITRIEWLDLETGVILRGTILDGYFFSLTDGPDWSRYAILGTYEEVIE